MPGIRYSIKVMEEPFYSFEFQTGIDLTSIVNSEILDNGQCSLFAAASLPLLPNPTTINESQKRIRRPSVPPRAPAPLPPSYLSKALQSLLSSQNTTSSAKKKKVGRPIKYIQHDLPVSFLNKRIIQRFPMNLYDKFRKKTISDLLPSGSEPPLTTSGHVEASASTSMTLCDPTSKTELRCTHHTVIPTTPAEFDNPHDLRLQSNNAASHCELDQFFNPKKSKFNCPFCKSNFKYKDTLKRHLLVKHTNGDGLIDYSKGRKGDFKSRKRPNILLPNNKLSFK